MNEETTTPKHRSRKKSITGKNILGLPIWGMRILGGGLAWFLFMNANLALHLFRHTHDNTHTRDALPVTFLERMWNAAVSGCPSYGCLIYPEEYQGETVERALRFANSTNFAFASSTFATMTRTSNRKVPPFNQDAAVAIMPYRTGQTPYQSDFFIGIFDGHGADGHLTAQHFRQDIPERLASRLDHVNTPDGDSLQPKSWMTEQLWRTFVEADDEAPPKIKLRGGCTASVVVRQDDVLYFANTGDSRTVLVSVNATEFQIVEQGPAPGVTELYSTRPDKANIPEEQSRIENAGGKIHIPPQNPNLSRVIVKSKEFRDTIGLAMSRSLGDSEWTEIGVIPDPLVDVIDLNSYQDIAQDPATSIFVIAASDGLWDLRLKQWHEKQFAESFLPRGDKRKKHPLTKMKEIIDVASPKKEDLYRDDITAIVIQVA